MDLVKEGMQMVGLTEVHARDRVGWRQIPAVETPKDEDMEETEKILVTLLVAAYLKKNESIKSPKDNTV